MFTGLIEACALVRRATPGAEGHVRLVVDNPWPDDVPALGGSVAVDGVCLTVVAPEAADGPATRTLAFVAGPETLRRTTLGALVPPRVVHLERALAFGARLGGHLVSGHVDGTGEVTDRREEGDSLYLRVRVPEAVRALSAGQGAITLAGVSLTITALAGNEVTVCLIPHTLEVTHLGRLKVGEAINCEADLLARYVARLVQPHLRAAQQGGAGGI